MATNSSFARSVVALGVLLMYITVITGLLTGSQDSSPEVPPTRAPLPSTEIVMNATAETSTGLPPEGDCETYYRLAMRLRGMEIADKINEGLGTSFCVAIEGNIVIASVEVELEIVNSIVRVDEIFDIPGQNHHRPYQLDTCAEEIALYLSDMGNWKQPLVPGQDDCAPLDFRPERFDQKSILWKCAEDVKDDISIEIPKDDAENIADESYGRDTGDIKVPRAENELFIVNTISKTLRTTDYTEISGLCRESYRVVVNQMGEDMVDDINANGRTNCTNSQLLSVDTEWTTFRNEAYLSYNFISEPGTETFQQMEDCFDDLEDYLVQHSSWGDPLIPPVAGCPDLNPIGDEFERRPTSWICYSSEAEALPEEVVG